MLTIGVILLVLGIIFGSAVLWSLGLLLVVLGAIFWVLGSMGRAVGGRRHYY